MGQEKETIFLEKYVNLPPYDLLYQGINLKDELDKNSKGIRLLIPKFFLHGTQRKEEYDNQKRRQVEYALKTQGINFLLQNPIIGCVIFENNHATIAILDGHHRTRYAALYGIKDIPALVSQPEDIVNILNRHGKKINKQDFVNETNEDISLAVHSFSIRNPKFIIPQALSGISKLDELSLRFKRL